MSSTGIIRKPSLASNNFTQSVGKMEAADTAFPGLHEGLRMTEGTIYQIHQDRPMVKAFADDRSPIANGKWIVLCHSPREIAERFGTLKKGMRLFVLFSGPDGGRAIGFICGEESEKNMNTPVLPNEISRGMFRVFAPGIGIG